MATTPIRTKLKIVNPTISDSPRTYLTADVDASPGTTVPISILSKRGFFKADRDPSLAKDEFLVLIGDYNQEKTEIKRSAADDVDNKVLNLDELSNSHSAADPVTIIDYDYIKVFGATTPGGAQTEIAQFAIDPTQSFTEYVYEFTAGVDPIQYAYFTTQFYNSHFQELSIASEEVEGTTFNRRSIKRIIESGAIKALTKVEESPNSVLNWNNCVDIVQDGIDEILTRKRSWPFWKRTYSGISTTPGAANSILPTDNNLLNFVKVNGEKIDFISELKYNQLTAYTTAPSETGQPIYYTIKNSEAYFYPVPNQALRIDYDYFYIPPTLVELSDTVPVAIVPILIYYCASMFAYIRGNDKRGDKMYAMFTKLLEQQVEEYTGPEQLGDAEEIEATDSRLWEE